MIFPLRFRRLEPQGFIFANEAGDFFAASGDFLERYAVESLTELDERFLRKHGFATDEEDDLFYVSYLRRLAARQAVYSPLSYVMLVPTLRCNLACTYCQVSRVSENSKGYDWSPETLKAVIRYLDGLETDDIKIEIQGGEPLLRLDLLQEIYDFCKARFRRLEYVVCTNLLRFGSAERAFFERPNVFVSTSLDGDVLTHQRNRTLVPETTESFFTNLRTLILSLGETKVSALPTINYADPPDIDAFIDSFESFGFRSIYLRPVNYQGFARRTHKNLRNNIGNWMEYYFKFIDTIIDRNFSSATFLEEYYFKLCLQRVLRAGHDSHVNLRNPTCFGRDYILIDYDGTFYPTDEARMMTRVGQVDLSIGNVRDGFAADRLEQLNSFAFNNFHQDCVHCPYQPFCGVDVIDDLSRYNRVDVRKHETWFCRQHMAIFDRIFSFIYSRDPKIRYSLLRWAGLTRQEIGLGLWHHDSTST